MGIDAVFRRLIEVGGDEIKHLVITGGEPLLWWRELRQLLIIVKGRGWFVEVETNGTLRPGELLDYVDEFNVSSKLSNSGILLRHRVNESALRDFVSSGKAVFKFVVDKPEDVNEVLWFIERFRMPRDRIYLMSQCITREECIAKDEEITKRMAMKLGVNFTPRLHILMGFR